MGKRGDDQFYISCKYLNMLNNWAAFKIESEICKCVSVCVVMGIECWVGGPRCLNILYSEHYGVFTLPFRERIK